MVPPLQSHARGAGTRGAGPGELGPGELSEYLKGVMESVNPYFAPLHCKNGSIRPEPVFLPLIQFQKVAGFPSIPHELVHWLFILPTKTHCGTVLPL